MAISLKGLVHVARNGSFTFLPIFPLPAWLKITLHFATPSIARRSSMRMIVFETFLP